MYTFTTESSTFMLCQQCKLETGSVAFMTLQYNTDKMYRNIDTVILAFV